MIADGAYASLLRYAFPRAVVITRLRRDAALNDLAPPRTGRRGRPRTRGDRLPKPPELAKRVTNWTLVKVDVRGQMVERLLWSRTLLWYETARSRPLLLVIVRDPAGHQRDDYFITSGTALTPVDVASLYSDRCGLADLAALIEDGDDKGDNDVGRLNGLVGERLWNPGSSSSRFRSNSGSPVRQRSDPVLACETRLILSLS